MNSRSEQLEKHEIIKAKLLEKLNDEDGAKFNQLWNCCSQMNVYIQQSYGRIGSILFGSDLSEFNLLSFDDIPFVDVQSNTTMLKDIHLGIGINEKVVEQNEPETFQPLTDFANFLLIVLKYMRMKDPVFNPANIKLDDKELLWEFGKIQWTESFVKEFGFTLLKAKYYLDNYLVHHSDEEDTQESNPWKLQCWKETDGKAYPVNLSKDNAIQDKLTHLLSMFEVSYSPRQRKNYLLYCMDYLITTDIVTTENYCQFVEGLANKYFHDIYLFADCLNDCNIPKPGSFDMEILNEDNTLNVHVRNKEANFESIYGNGLTMTKGAPLFVFNYLDYKLWEMYDGTLKNSLF